MGNDRTPALPIVAIVGRPNVGKSMLFNRITGSGHAVVDDAPGVTRDRNYKEAEWTGHRFVVVDTGGLLPSEDGGMAGLIRVQAGSAIDDADAIVFVVDRSTGVTAIDLEIAALLRQGGTPVVLAVNKVDAGSHELDVHEFYSLGLGDPAPVSALHARGSGDLMDRVVAAIPRVEQEGEAEGIRVALVGRPNVGKSSLVNRIVGSNIVIVDSTPGTTRDAIDTSLDHEGRRFVLVDTAGLRRKSKVEKGVEYYSSMRALRSIERCDVVVLVADATSGIVAQDARIVGFAEEAGKGLLIAFNKWDLIEKGNETAGEYVEHARETLAFAQYPPILQVSALTGQRVAKILTLAGHVYDQSSIRIPTHEVNEFIMRAVEHRPPKAGRRGNILYATQIGVRPPRLVIFVSDIKAIDNSYKRYLVNRLRAEYGFEGTPIRVSVRKRRR